MNNMERVVIKNILKEYTNQNKVILTEQQLNETLLNEGWKDVLLGIALLTGVGLSSGQAQTAKDALKNQETINKIENVLSNEDLLSKLTQKLPKEVSDKIQSNADKALEDLEGKHGRVTSTTKARNEKQLASRLKAGYAITDVKTDVDTIHLDKPHTIITWTDTLEIPFEQENLFKTGQYVLSDNGTNIIQAIKDSIVNTGGKIVLVQIESSTDKEPIHHVGDQTFKDDIKGNEYLAKMRAESVSKLFSDVSEVDINTLPNQGPDVYSHTMSKEDRASARKQTAQYRYDKIKIVAIFQDSIPDPSPEPEDKIIEKNTYTLIKTINQKTGTKELHGKSVKVTKHKVVKRKKVGSCKVDGCPRFKSKKLEKFLNFK